MNTTTPAIGVIGGSGLYQIESLSDAEEVRIETPFGAPDRKSTRLNSSH